MYCRHAEGVSKFAVSRKCSIRPFGTTYKQTEEDRSHFEKPGRPPFDTKFTSSTKHTTQPLTGGGFIPETTKPGLRIKTEHKPHDNVDVIRYEYAGKINSIPNLNVSSNLCCGVDFASLTGSTMYVLA